MAHVQKLTLCEKTQAIQEDHRLLNTKETLI